MPQPYNPWGTPVFPDNAAFGTGSPAEDAQRQPNMLDNLLSHIAGALGRGFMAPGQALQSTTPITSDQMVAPAMDIAGATTLGAGAIPAEANSLRMGIKAYHSSPHDFDRFDLSKIGTGEGAQAYGHGLYFAESPAVSGKGGQYWQQFKEKFGTDPHTYEVNLNADPAHLLDWDKPVSQQSEAVRRALAEKAWADQRATAADLLDVHVPGEQAYKRMVTGQGGTALPGLSRQPQALSASEQLQEAGIPGIRYLDQGSRANVDTNAIRGSLSVWEKALSKTPNDPYAVQQVADLQKQLAAAERGATSNYVMFDDKLIDILKKYGLAGFAAPPIFANATSEQKQ